MYIYLPYFLITLYCICFSGDDHERFDTMTPINGDMYPTGQPMDHEPSMGQVPIVPPGTPPGDGWVPHFNGLPPNSFMGRRSPSIPMSQPPMMPADTMAMMGPGNMGNGPRIIPSDVNGNEPSYSNYPHGNTQLEVY